jgi:hypothetical protein
MKISPIVGLCATCKYVHLLKSAKGSFFLRCNLAKTDPRFQKYPVLPVLQCAGFERVEPDQAPPESPG